MYQKAPTATLHATFTATCVSRKLPSIFKVVLEARKPGTECLPPGNDHSSAEIPQDGVKSYTIWLMLYLALSAANLMLYYWTNVNSHIMAQSSEVHCLSESVILDWAGGYRAWNCILLMQKSSLFWDFCFGFCYFFLITWDTANSLGYHKACFSKDRLFSPFWLKSVWKNTTLITLAKCRCFHLLLLGEFSVMAEPCMMMPSSWGMLGCCLMELFPVSKQNRDLHVKHLASFIFVIL